MTNDKKRTFYFMQRPDYKSVPSNLFDPELLRPHLTYHDETVGIAMGSVGGAIGLIFGLVFGIKGCRDC